jgi:hypothetical protein
VTKSLSSRDCPAFAPRESMAFISMVMPRSSAG